MFVAIVCCELHLPYSGSLKHKRRVVRSLVERLHQRYRISVAETGSHDLLQRAELGLAAVAGDERELRRLMDELRRLIDDEEEAVLLGWEPDFLEGNA